MIQINDKRTVKALGIFAIILCVFLLFSGSGLAQNLSGMNLKLYLMDDRPNPEYKITEMIGLIGVIKNETAWPLNTNVGITEIELEQHLIATDPYGVKHVSAQDFKAAEDMPPSSTWGELGTVPAEVIPPGYERSVQINDLKTLFSSMNTIPGEWKLKTVITLSRFLYTITTKDGIQGVDDRAWHGTLESNEIRILVVPETGARLRVRVEDLSKPQIKACRQIEVRVYRQSDIETGDYALAEAWKKLDPMATGKTDQGGWVTLPKGASCFPRPLEGDAYVAIAEYKGEYKDAVFEYGEEGWASKCSGRLERIIFFGERITNFSIFGINSVWLRNNARVESGNVGVLETCEACLVSGFEMALEGGAWVDDSLILKANRVYIESDASVWDVNCNVLQADGNIRGEVTTPLDEPVWDPLPEFNQVSGALGEDVFVASQEVMDLLPPGDYGDISVGAHATLNIIPGLYQIRNLILGSHAKIICNEGEGEEKLVEIRIAERIISGSAKASYIGPSTDSGIKPKDIVIYVAGTPDAVMLGQGNQIKANVYAPSGSFTSGEGCMLEGSFIAKDITIGQKSIVTYDGAFSTEEPGPGPADEIILTATSYKLRAQYYVDLNWTGATSAEVDIYSNGTSVTSTPNDGSYTTGSFGKKPSGTYTYVVCDQGTDNCSNEDTIEF
jgi:hypothetical protein